MIDRFEFRAGELWCEKQPVRALAERYGTPLYVYSTGTLRGHFERLGSAFAPLHPAICFSVKCCANTHILRQLASWGSGFDVVSGGEYFRARRAGAKPEQIVFAGVGKTLPELEFTLRDGVGLLNIESESELAQLAELAARLKLPAAAAVRVNPDVDAKTHAYTTTGTKENKFGITLERTRALFDRYAGAPHLVLRGLHLHIGSPVHSVEAYVASIQRALGLSDELRAAGHAVDTLDIGGGFGAHYEGSEAPTAAQYAAAVCDC